VGQKGALIRSLLPEPEVIVPQVGELVLFNTRFMHAVPGFSQGTRVTLHTFIQYAEGKPLALGE
jgi:hypothetical protein